MKSNELTPEILRLVARDIDGVGHAKVVAKGDNEPGMRSLLGRVSHREGTVRTPHDRGRAPAYEPQASRLAERCIQTIKGLYRTTRSALEHRIGQPLPDDRPVQTWMTRHAACLHNRCHVGQDGRTPWERVTGKRTGTAVAEFDEKVMHLARGPNRERNGSFGTWLGLVTRTQGTFVGPPEGVVRA